MLLPGTIEECFEFGWRAFDLAERLQTPIFVLSDLDLGMNLWMSTPFVYPNTPMDRGKVLSAQDLERLGEFARYRDVDGDGIPYRTLPGTDHPLAAYFTRGTGHTDAAVYSESPEEWEANIKRLWRKLETARGLLPAPVVEAVESADLGLIAFGSTDPALREARARLGQAGLETDYLRIRALPFSEDIGTFIENHERIYVIELNTDGQMQKLLQLEYPQHALKIRSLTHNNGLPLSARWIVEAILADGGR
jgi:2-oxoglutarate ferredoxin oxidoreductase subunit alpha